MWIKDIKYEGLGIYRIDMQPNNGIIIKFEANNIQNCKEQFIKEISRDFDIIVDQKLKEI
jgi:predicted nuclease of restriction endonuclease-like (RecB) superfamily